MVQTLSTWIRLAAATAAIWLVVALPVRAQTSPPLWVHVTGVPPQQTPAFFRLSSVALVCQSESGGSHITFRMQSRGFDTLEPPGVLAYQLMAAAARQGDDWWDHIVVTNRTPPRRQCIVIRDALLGVPSTHEIAGERRTIFVLTINDRRGEIASSDPWECVLMQMGLRRNQQTGGIIDDPALGGWPIITIDPHLPAGTVVPPCARLDILDVATVPPIQEDEP